MTTRTGSFVWYELMTSDPDGAARFYTEVAGWGTQPFSGGDNPYTVWTVQGEPIGGFMRLTPEMDGAGIPPHWTPYVLVADASATAAKATSLGGSVLVPPQDIPDVGRFAIIADPQGATIAIYTPGSESPPRGGEARLGDFSWHELMTTNWRAAFDFYSRIFGWEKTSDFDMGPEAGTYQMYGQNGRPYGGMFNKTPDIPAPPNWLCYIHVADAVNAAETVKRLGGTVINGPLEVPGGDWVAQCLDPQGAAFAVHSTKR